MLTKEGGGGSPKERVGVMPRRMQWGSSKQRGYWNRGKGVFPWRGNGGNLLSV